MDQDRTRLAGLDILRGLAVAGMILVVSPGDWAATYAPLRHADWNGWTLADLVFPTFLFAVGAALGLSFPRAWAAADRRAFARRVVRRAVLLVALGLLLEATFNWAVGWTGGPIGRPGLANLRIPGILQRIALCYLLAATLVAATGRRDGRLAIRPVAVAAAAAALLLLYWALLRFVPVPGYGVGRLDPEGNLAAFVDRALFTPAHLWPLGWVSWGGPVVYDPEGLLATLPATANVLFGVLAAVAWQARPARAIVPLVLAGILAILAGLALDPAIAINKRLWTPSFALLSGGFGAVLLAGSIAAAAVRVVVPALAPLRVLGGNAVLAFVLATLLGRVYDLPFIGGQAPRAWLNGVALRLIGDPPLASTACAALFVAVVTLLLRPLHRRGIHLRL